MRVAVFGSGHVGLTTAICLAFCDHEVTVVDIDEERVLALCAGQLPFFEPDIETLFMKCRSRLRFTTDCARIVESDVALLAVPSPLDAQMQVDLSYLRTAATNLATALGHRTSSQPMLVVNKSTVPVGTARWLQELITERLRLLSAESSLLPGSREDSFSISSAPEFLREGKAVYDTLFPDRLIFGVSCEDDARRLQTLYAPIIARRFPRDDLEHQSAERPPHVMVTTVMTAELIKYAGNAFLATKLSFINELAPLCASVGVSVVDIADGIGLDHRIGREFLNAGIGWGGSCLGKDTQGLRNMAIEYGLDTPLLAAVMAVNERQRDAVMGLLQQELLVLKGSRIALLGLAFKPGTDDLRDAPSLDIARKLLRVGATVSGYDPAVKHVPVPQLRLATSVLEMSEGADALVLVTEWSEFQDLPWSQIASRMRKPVMIDGRNLLSPRLLSDSGFSYRGIGR